LPIVHFLSAGTRTNRTSRARSEATLPILIASKVGAEAIVVTEIRGTTLRIMSIPLSPMIAIRRSTGQKFDRDVTPVLVQMLRNVVLGSSAETYEHAVRKRNEAEDICDMISIACGLAVTIPQAIANHPSASDAWEFRHLHLPPRFKVVRYPSDFHVCSISSVIG
jgi:hypothetical protein